VKAANSVARTSPRNESSALATACYRQMRLGRNLRPIEWFPSTRGCSHAATATAFPSLAAGDRYYVDIPFHCVDCGIEKPGPAPSRNGGARWQRVLFTPAPSVAGPAGGKRENGGIRRDKFIWRVRPKRSSGSGRQERNHHELDKRWFLCGAALRHFASLTAIFAKIGLEVVDSDFATLIIPMAIVVLFITPENGAVLLSFLRGNGSCSD
jgi:hypothetical protein